MGVVVCRYARWLWPRRTHHNQGVDLVKPKPPTCAGCQWETRGQSYVPGLGPTAAKLAFIGQGPGRDECYAGEPWVGSAGRRLKEIWCAKASIPPQLCWFDNATRCRIIVRGKDAAPAKAVAECRWRHWEPALVALPNLEMIVTLGTEASRALLGPWYSERAAGSVEIVELS